MQNSLPLSVRIGRSWFQWRSFSPIPLFLSMLVLKPDMTWSGNQYALLLVGVVFAESLRLWAVGYAGSTTRTRGDSVKQLVHAGPYRFVRNPLYIANILLYTFCSLIFGFTMLSGFVFIYAAIEYFFIVSFEEQILRDTFGIRYTEYCSKVPKWIFAFAPQINQSEHEFSLRKALRSERSTFYSILVMTLIFGLKKFFL